uniref:4-hydroxy-tetrahydrodipicolinate synthase n=1 Tax=Chromera velia CCMP2878 TaxID=1169474 RepID=A0A0G4HSD3_9ALVE|eukprot:Cvel_8228.t1-p1 / transcript=Cvel_8228.t1 / gene=Cvel_8228 / organism=Chromera_velia_CCMP2878 / gene_product=4-hydroxy-tetrahydrodipicolinate synthase, putative / transcript_product=4-hydroxy-tetrahydrodipicolinate synthase, putative / location=Cvel_scaffold449:52749-60462(-) / protein_length=313 / sequence_SO=supercontig / SO=protein_coding / is_pseudo=false
MKPANFHGLYPAIVTPMFENGDIDYEAFKRLIDWHISEGTNGLCVLGTTGESPTVDEFEEVVKCAVSHSAGRIPIVAGTGTNSTKTTIEKTKKALKLGADGALIVTPYYNKPSQDGLYCHFATVAAAAPELPIILYNVPGRTGVDMLPETTARLSKVPNIVATKEASGKQERYTELPKMCEEGFLIFTGEDGQACNAVLSGCCGVISVTGNVAPRQMVSMIQAAREGKADVAKSIDACLQDLHKAVFSEPSPAPVKFLLAQEMGKIKEGIRGPLLPATLKVQEPLRAAYKKALTAPLPEAEKNERKEVSERRR